MKTIPAFTCQMCGHCCKGTGGIVVSPEEQDRLCRFLNMDRVSFLAHYAEKKSSKYIIRSDETGYCIFFKRDTGCTVHPAKPDVCRAWPFFRGNLVDRISWEMAQDYCPGICKDVTHEEFVRQGMAYLKSHCLIHQQTGDANALKVSDIEKNLCQKMEPRTHNL